MNERIEKFARECGAWNQVYGNRMFMIDEHFDIEKFAQLIVQECISVMKSTVDESIDFERKLDETSSWIESDIKKHFGVEDRAVPILSADEQALFAGIASSKLFTIAGAKKQFGVEE